MLAEVTTFLEQIMMLFIFNLLRRQCDKVYTSTTSKVKYLTKLKCWIQYVSRLGIKRSPNEMLPTAR
jgi:hypothetical protein